MSKPKDEIIFQDIVGYTLHTESVLASDCGDVFPTFDEAVKGALKLRCRRDVSIVPVLEARNLSHYRDHCRCGTYYVEARCPNCGMY